MVAIVGDASSPEEAQTRARDLGFLRKKNGEKEWASESSPRELFATRNERRRRGARQGERQLPTKHRRRRMSN
jgi:hypothetical protein